MMDKVTSWFSGDIRPVHHGLYEKINKDTGNHFWSWWNGDFWSVGAFDQGQAVRNKNVSSVVQLKWPWRGLAEQPK